MKKTMSLGIALLLLSPAIVLAENSDPVTKTPEVSSEDAIQVQVQTQNESADSIKKPIQKRQEKRQKVRRFSNLSERKNNRTEVRTQRANKRQEFANDIATKKNAAKNRIEAKRTELKEKLKIIKDQRKQKIIENIDKRLNELNSRIANRLIAVLDKFDKIIAKIENRSDALAEKGIDVSTVDTALLATENNLAISRSAVATQAEKTYSLVNAIDSEKKLRTNVGAVRQQLHQDLVSVRETVRSSRESLKEALQALIALNK